MKPQLVFVYNADSGLFNTMADIAHKLISPQTYSCNLCALTHTAFGMKDDWRDFLETLNAELEFLHRDEFVKAGGSDSADLPAIFLRKEITFDVWMSAAEINKLEDLESLKSGIHQRLQAE
ncbi:MAG: hypothetical protein ACRBF0_20210 [Calditrichia bacterium]